VARRWWVIGIYAILLGASVPFALKVEQDNAIDRLIVQDDPDFVATRAFAKVFGNAEYVVLFAEAKDPFAPDVIAEVDALDRKLQAIPKVGSNSVLSIYHRSRPDADPVANPSDFKAFATGTPLFKQQGLVGDGFYGLPMILDVTTSEERAAVLAAIDAAVADVVAHPAPLEALRKVGEPYVNDHLNRETAEGGTRMFPVFFAFVVVLVVGLYRSFRALLAIVISMAVNVALAVGFIGVLGGTFTIVSVLVPMTIMVTCLATLVYLHSRFVERPPDRDLEVHRVFAMANKFLPCTASIFATAAGFAALAVSAIRPIREMGVWLAIGLVFTWAIVFTLFPALQKVLATPTQVERKTAAQWFLRLAAMMPRASYRGRWITVPAALVLSGVGAIALFGFPGVVEPMQMLTDPIEYVNSGTQLYKDTKRVGNLIPGLSMADVWLKGRVGTLNQPEVIRGIDAFQDALEKDEMVGSAVGPTTVLRMIRYVGGKGDRLPDDPDGLEAITDSFESLVNQEPLLARFVDKADMSQTHVTLVTRINDFPTYEVLGERVVAAWKATVEKHPALKEFEGEPRMVGLGRLQTKVAHNLVPTLVESFLLTVAIIFSVFLLVFRNGAARLMAMIPSLFAILVMFAIMRLLGMSLNVATILIASTVLGTSENDQIHFFYHFLEGREGGRTEPGLRHTTLIAGRSIFFATLINAIGFLAFALSDLPPIRQFAILAAIAFALSMIADFTALPGALWMVFRDKPGEGKRS
jgi:predicted RND superfamily exporter protein